MKGYCYCICRVTYRDERKLQEGSTLAGGVVWSPAHAYPGDTEQSKKNPGEYTRNIFTRFHVN